MRYSRGFTLVELMVVLAILAIGAAVAVPSYNSFMTRNRIAAVSNEFVSVLSFARMEAIKRGYRVGVRASAATANNEWGGGLVVWADINNDGIQNAGEEVLRNMQGSNETTLDSQAGITFLAFDSRGFANSNDVIRLCASTASSGGVDIELLRSGRVRVSQGANCS